MASVKVIKQQQFKDVKTFKIKVLLSGLDSGKRLTLTKYRKKPKRRPEVIEMKEIGASKLKEQLLEVLDHLDVEGLVITKEGQPIAKLTPLKKKNHAHLIGIFKNDLKINGDIMSTGLKWDAES